MKKEIAKAYYLLGECFLEGTEVEKNEFKAYLYLEEAAKFGDERAIRMFAEYYRKQGDKERAFAWYEKASKEDADAQYYLGSCYEEGRKPVTKDFAKAYTYYEQAAKLGHKKARKKMKYQKLSAMKEALVGLFL